ncbi:hypothetical protein [Streptomyces sp. AP-93]|nr:hypothetical protein [Streptomyces sp. AP-93]MCJ0872817.1 hypothetical protein [Streptomyces sp. AP-93]
MASPQPPRPGVISLRPLTPGEILGGAFAALARYGGRLATAQASASSAPC